MCEALGLLLVAEVGFFLPVARKRSCPCRTCARVGICVYTHMHLCVVFHTMQTHVCLLLIERGLFPRLVEAGGRLGLKPGCSLPAGTRVRKVENRVF